MTAQKPASAPSSAELDAARLLLAWMGLAAEDLLAGRVVSLSPKRCATSWRNAGR